MNYVAWNIIFRVSMIDQDALYRKKSNELCGLSNFVRAEIPFVAAITKKVTVKNFKHILVDED